MSDADLRYAIGDLATLGGVSRRTVRYYVQEGLIAPPLGLGRGNHYSPQHLEQLLRVKGMQESGLTLDEIRRTRAGRDSGAARKAVAAGAPPVAPSGLSRSVWRRLAVAPGVELHVESAVDLPSPTALRELADWCQRHLEAATTRPDKDKD